MGAVTGGFKNHKTGTRRTWRSVFLYILMTYSGGGYGMRVTVAIKEVYKEGVSAVYATQNQYEDVTGKFRDFNFNHLDLLLN